MFRTDPIRSEFAYCLCAPIRYDSISSAIHHRCTPAVASHYMPACYPMDATIPPPSEGGVAGHGKLFEGSNWRKVNGLGMPSAVSSTALPLTRTTALRARLRAGATTNSCFASPAAGLASTASLPPISPTTHPPCQIQYEARSPMECERPILHRSVQPRAPSVSSGHSNMVRNCLPHQQPYPMWFHFPCTYTSICIQPGASDSIGARFEPWSHPLPPASGALRQRCQRSHASHATPLSPIRHWADRRAAVQ